MNARVPHICALRATLPNPTTFTYHFAVFPIIGPNVGDVELNVVSGDFAADLKNTKTWEAIGDEAVCEGHMSGRVIERATGKPADFPVHYKSALEKIVVEN